MFATGEIYTSRSAPRADDYDWSACDAGTTMDERRLWVSVLIAAMADALEDPQDIWVGDFPSRDFCEVCTLAGLDPLPVWHALRRTLDSPAEVRAAARRRIYNVRMGPGELALKRARRRTLESIGAGSLPADNAAD